MMESFLVYGFASIALVAAAFFVTFRQPVHAALAFAASVLAVSGLYLLQRSPFVAAANVVIYAGATIIIFLFVLMFAQKTHLQTYDLKSSNPVWAVLASICLAGLLIYVIREATPDKLAKSNMMMMTPMNAQPTVLETAVPSTTTAGPSEPDSIGGSFKVVDLGREMYTHYLWTIELAGTVLLVATIGAILIAQKDADAESNSGAVSP